MHRFFPVALSNTARRLGVVLVTSLAAVTLASCGGGTQAKKFVPESLVVFGDDFSLITSDGVAGVAANEGATYGTAKFETGSSGPYDCRECFNWVMYFANSVGFKFGNECNQALSERTDLKTAVMLANDPVDVRVDSDESVARAYTNAGADAIAARMHANLSLLNNGTLVTVNAGRADIVKAYRAYLASTTSLSVLEAQLEQTGRRFARSLKPVVNTGARVLLILSPGLGESPLANTDGKKAELKALSAAFNKGVELESAVVATGQQLGLVRLDQVLDSMVAQFVTYGTGNVYGLTNISASSCSTPAQSAPLCVEPESDSGTDTDASRSTTYLWAGPTQVGNTSTMRDLFLTYLVGRLNAQPF